MLDEEDRSLIAAAASAAELAYCPYSRYPVGAALETDDGAVFTGCNIENAAYPACICAERVALVKAVSEGKRRFKRIAVVTRTGGAPCGVCRQMLYEFAPDLRVLIADGAGSLVFEGALSDLLPLGFGGEHLR
jgi:cytidine deaminase